MSFANEVRRWLSPTSVGGQMALALVVSTILCAAIPAVGSEVIFHPADVIQRFKAWQLVTGTFAVAPAPLSILFGVIIVLQGGSWLSDQWTGLGVWRFVFGVNVLANAACLLVGLIWPAVFLGRFPGGETTISAIWVAQGLIVGAGRLNFFGFPVSGYAFALIGAGFTLLQGLTSSWAFVMPELFGLLITVAWIQGYTPGQLWLRFRSNQLNRDLRRRASRLSVIDGDKKGKDYLN